MAQNITLLGASYSGVPSVVLPKTGGGTAQFDDTTIASNAASASDITSGKLAFVNGELVTGTASGGGGLDIPTFTVTNGVATCNKTYAECMEYHSENPNVAYVSINDTFFYPGQAYEFDVPNSLYIVYVFFVQGIPALGLKYRSDGVIELINEGPSATQATFTQNGTYSSGESLVWNEVTVDVSGGIKTATGTFTGNGTRTIDVSCSWEPDLVYFTSNPGTTASSGTVAAIIVRGMMAATRYRNNSTSNSHYAIPGIANMNSSGSSYSWRATYANSKVTLYCYSSNARSLLTNGRTYSYTFMKWT